ncbi:MAG: PD-(D/E)XK nuclease family protein [Bacillota bacterium]
MKLADIKNNALVFSQQQAKDNLLLELKEKNQIIKLHFSNGLNLFNQVKNNYPFFIYQKFKIKADLAKRILKYLPFIDVNKTYNDKKLNQLKTIKAELIKVDIYQDINYNNYPQIISLDKGIVPKFIKEYDEISAFKPQYNSIPLIKSENQIEQVYSVYEKVVELLETGIDINKIKIVNTLNEDNYQLQKLFFDSKIPFVINKPINLTKYPLYKIFKAKFNKESLTEVKAFLKNNQDKHPEVVNKIINFFNRYKDSQINANKAIFIYQLEQVSLTPEKYLNAVEIITTDKINLYQDNHYLFVNYIDEVFPKKTIDNDYLTDKQKHLINYFTTEEINRYELNYYSHLFDSIEHLYLFMPVTIIDKTRKSRLKLNRQIIAKDYKYQAKTKSYLSSLNYLRYAKLHYNYLNYNLETKDYPLLASTYNPKFKLFNPQFSGINKTTLDKLLINYSITGAKLEALTLCPFQYFLTYLLRLGEDIDNHYLFFGNVIHKALENLAINANYDYIALVKNTGDFPKDIVYKEKLYQEILIDIIEYIYQEVKKLHNASQYQTILTEQSFNFKLNKADRFFLKGIIDKVMLDNVKHYFTIIDYKFSDKSFSEKEFNQGLKQQLPFYLFAYAKQSDYKPSGIFYRQTSKSRDKVFKKSDNRLNGVYLADTNQMRRFDMTGENILGLSYTKTGIKKSPRALSENDFQELIKKVEANILKAAKTIEAGKFFIEPIVSEEINNESISCRYCEFSAICYSKNKRIKGANNEIH